MDAFAAVMDDACAFSGDGSGVVRERLHPDSTTRALAVRLPCTPGEEAKALERAKRLAAFAASAVVVHARAFKEALKCGAVASAKSI